MEDGKGRWWGRGVVSAPRACSGTHHPIYLPPTFLGEVAHTLPLLHFVAGAVN